MLKALTPLITAALFAASTALYAQQTTPAPAPKADKSERHEKAREAMKKAHAACDAKKGDERRDCMRKEMCASASDPAKCEARAKDRMAMRAKAFEACKDKTGDERRACMREQRGRNQGDKK
jgi:hypothetical protein